MRPNTPLVDRIAKGTGVCVEMIQDTISRPTPGEGPCWEWNLSFAGVTPMIMLDGRPQPVRRVLVASIHGELPSTIRVVPVCPNKRCVNPNHTMVKNQFVDGLMTLTPPADFETAEDDIMDVVDTVYSTEQPWDAASLAEQFPVYTEEQFAEAIRKIEDEGL